MLLFGPCVLIDRLMDGPALSLSLSPPTHLGIPHEGEHELVRVEDAGGRGEERLANPQPNSHA